LQNKIKQQGGISSKEKKEKDMEDVFYLVIQVMVHAPEFLLHPNLPWHFLLATVCVNATM